MHLEPGDRLDRYVVEGLLGKGGMASVYRVRHRTLGTRHAVKLLALAATDLQERLYQEGRVQASLRHPNIVTVSDVIEHNGMPGLVMEYIEGPSLDLWLHHYRPTVDEAVQIFRGVLAGVGAAHAQNLVHRDLKPGNVMLDLRPQGAIPRVADFGLVKVRSGPRSTRSGTTMGTPTYMAPEQIRDASKVDRRADMYSLGVLLYELCTGELPYDETDLITLFQRVVAADRVPAQEREPSIPDAVAAAIDGLMVVRPDERMSDCASVLAMLDGIDPSELTWSIRYEPGEVLPEPTPLPPNVPNSTLPQTSRGIEVARGLVTQLPEVTTRPDPAPEVSTVVLPDAAPPRRRWWALALLPLPLLLAAAVVALGAVLALVWWLPISAPPPRPLEVVDTPDAPTPEPPLEPVSPKPETTETPEAPEPAGDPNTAPERSPTPTPPQPVATPLPDDPASTTQGTPCRSGGGLSRGSSRARTGPSRTQRTTSRSERARPRRSAAFPAPSAA